MCLLTCLAQLRSLCLGRSRIFALNGKEQRVPLQAQTQLDVSCYGSFRAGRSELPSRMGCLAGASWPEWWGVQQLPSRAACVTRIGQHGLGTGQPQQAVPLAGYGGYGQPHAAMQQPQQMTSQDLQWLDTAQRFQNMAV